MGTRNFAYDKLNRLTSLSPVANIPGDILNQMRLCPSSVRARSGRVAPVSGVIVHHKVFGAPGPRCWDPGG
jgi:hypothetical protein